MPTITIYITGQVQGVFYRKSAHEKASEMGITGNVRNLPDGRVQIIADGTKHQLDDLIDWCRQGPPKATVIDVQWEEAASQNFDKFSVIR